ncbi:type I restriction-modification system subunit M [Myroides odoratimimus]|uniref:type I restriction-modification system subunit M n=1 Tax=Myroides odoratimimus TaxID=76832 RepID=UPI0025778C74|nr:type I restriction-modification system subunit M [Myroides odoratimimus]MDM1094903.1 N-6 DNA methylase [Myroides odoratimimus]
MITKQALGSTLFGMADILRDKVEDYKAYILSLLFFKRLSDNYEWESENAIKEFIKEHNREPNEKETKVIITKKHDFKIPEGCFWKDVRNASIDKKNEALHKAVNGIANINVDKDGRYILKGVINTVRWNEPAPDGSGGKKLDPNVLHLLISYLDAVDLSNKNASVDVLGDAYEYLIKRFADENKGGTTAGQFYTPQEVVDVIVRYLKPQKNDTIYDPTCGSGGFLINSAKYCKSEYGSQKSVRLFGQEDVWNTWAIANINMILHGLDARVEKGDTLKEPKFVDEENELKIRKFNKVVANFPFSQENWWKNGEPKKDAKGKKVNKKDGSPQLEYSSKETFKDPYDRFEYGIPPFSNGDFAFLQHIVASLTDDGKAGVICPQGVLFRGQPEKTEEEDGQKRKADDEYLIRRGFLQGAVDINGEFTHMKNIVDAIVVLPGNLFYGTTIPGSILFFDKNKPKHRKDKVLMIYAAKEGWYKEEPNMNVLLPHDTLRISAILESWGDLDIAKAHIATQKTRLWAKIQEDLGFKINEIEEYYQDDIEILNAKVATAKDNIKEKESEGKAVTKSLHRAFETANVGLEKTLKQKADKLLEVHEQAAKERKAIDEVEIELIEMLQNPELRKRYFAIVDMEELDENEFNLNIPRYVDTFEPEVEIDLETAISEFNALISKENETDKAIAELLKFIK